MVSTFAYCAEPVKIGILAYRPKTQTTTQWQPLAIALNKSIPNREFSVSALAFTELEAAVANHQVDFVLTNPGHYVLLADKYSLSAPLATLAQIENGKKSSTFGGVIFCKAERKDISTLADVKGKSISLTSIESFGGYQAQAFELGQVGIRLPRDAKLLSLGMPHDNVVDAVMSGKSDIGFVRTGVLEAMILEGRLEVSRIKIINSQNFSNFTEGEFISSRQYPEWTFSALSTVDENLARHVAASLFLLEENKAVTNAIGIHGFVVPADYTPVVELLKDLRLPPYDAPPKFTWQDVLAKYRNQFIGGFIGLLAIFLLGFRLILIGKRLEDEHRIVLKQKKLLQDSETHLRAVIENEPECIKLVDETGQLLQMNPAGLEMIEADSPEQVIGKPVLNIIAPEYRTAFGKMHKRVISGESLELEFEVQGLKGGRRYLQTHAVPMQVNGKTVHLAITRDITQRKIIENELHIQRDQNQRYLDTTLALMVALDWNGNITMANRATQNLLGYSSEDLLGQNWFNKCLPSPEGMKVVFPVFRKLMSEELGIGSEFENSVLCKDGSQRLIAWRNTPLISPEGKVQGVLSSGVDITERKKIESQLTKSYSLLNATIESTDEAILVVDLSGRWVLHNQNFIELWNIPDEILAAKHDSEALQYVLDQLKNSGEFSERVSELYATPEKESFDTLEFINGKVVERNSFPQLIEGEIVGRVWIFRDITNRVQAERTITESRNLLLTIIDTVPMRIFWKDLNLNYLGCNTLFARDGGVNAAIDVIGKNDYMLGWAKQADLYRSDDKAVIESGVARLFYDEPQTTPSGDLIWLRTSKAPLRNIDGKIIGLLGIYEDITVRKQMEEKINKLAFYDPLTNLPNRRLLNDRLEQAIIDNKRSGRFSALMFIDLDNFKPLNDLHGHKVGDLLLIEVAQRISSCIREVDTVARFGGDEFVVILGKLDLNQDEATLQAGVVAEKIRTSLSVPYLLDFAEIASKVSIVEHHCTSSIGVVVFNSDRCEDVLKRADIAMYEAKNSGKNSIAYSPNNENAIEKKMPALNLSWDITYDCGENTIDREHRKLFELANTLIETSFARDAHPEAFTLAFDQLLTHLTIHFSDEEEILKHHHFSGLEAHSHTHKILLERALQLRDESEKADSPIEDVVNFFAEEVVMQHILIMDRNFYSLFKSANNDNR